MDIVCLSSQTARSAGDALRELDSMDVSIVPNLHVLELMIVTEWRSTILTGPFATCFEL
jgi:hypothetical protein